MRQKKIKMEQRGLKEFCALFGVFGAPNASRLTHLGLYALQHRGQEGCGIVSSDGETIYHYKGMGLVNEVFDTPEILSNLKGNRAIGHNRYSTTGSSALLNTQPILITYKDGQLAVAHNGNLTNAFTLRSKMEKKGSIFQSTSDSEIILHLVAQSTKPSLVEKISEALSKVQGAYSLLFLNQDQLIAARDPKGFRPLALGRLGKAWVVASETCAFDLIGAKYIRDVYPGEILSISPKGLKSISPFPKQKHSFCIFEFIYFARPDSKIFGENVDKIRRRLGRKLAEEQPAEADIVISVPDSSNTATIGYSEGSGIKSEIGLIRNHYIGRTFIHPDQRIRDFDAKIKYNPVKGVLKNKKVVIVDDSIVRGTTSKKLVKMIKKAGAKEVHFRVSSPPLKSPCFYGIDMPTKKELIGSNKSVEQIRKHLGADSLGYLSVEGMLSTSTITRKENFCTACFTGKYPTVIEKNIGKLVLEKR